MGLFGTKSEPSLTKIARRVSIALASMDVHGRELAVKTIKSLIIGIRSLGNLATVPHGHEITSELWDALVTIARKSIMGAKPDRLFEELKAGLSPELLETIEREARH